MEDNTKDFDEKKGSQDLVHLPEILPLALGILTIKEALQRQTATNILRANAKSISFDVEMYKNSLHSIWGYNHTSSAYSLVKSMIVDIAMISVILEQISGDDKRAARDILCRYLQTYGYIMCDQTLYAEAIVALEEAVSIAEYVNNNQLLAITLLRLGNVYHDRGDIALAQSKIDLARGDTTGAKAKRASADADFQATMKHFARIRSMKNIALEINIALLMGEGNVQARMAYGDKHRILTSLTLLSRAEKIIVNNYLKDSLEDEYSVFAGSIDVAKRQVQISKASALLAVDWPREALQELTEMLNLPPLGNMTRMNAYTNLLWAQGYADIGKLDGAALLAQDSLTVMKRIKSEVNIERIRSLYRQLINTDSGQIEAIRLGVLLG
jgi:tetratricopeptide (TPR) repeat protein